MAVGTYSNSAQDELQELPLSEEIRTSTTLCPLDGGLMQMTKVSSAIKAKE
jgi:hypothetical protein